MTDNRNIPIGSGNYNERVEGDYIQGNYNAPVIHGGSGNNITFNRIQAPKIRFREAFLLALRQGSRNASLIRPSKLDTPQLSF